jgi:coenzyme F420-reducing hydrogenase delta subunit/ferredoxin
VKIPHLESVFLNPSPLPEERDLARVLVLGGDGAGIEPARRIASEGFDVLLLGESSVEEFERVTSIPGELEEIVGFVGAFEAVIKSQAGGSRERVGFIVAAPSPRAVPKFSKYGLEPSERVVSLSDLENSFEEGEALPGPKRDRFHAVFLCGLEGGSDPSELGRVLDAIDRLRELYPVQPYIFTRDVKVAAAGMEKRYGDAREKGALFFKFDGSGPVTALTPDGPVMSFREPLLGLEMELEPDLLVVDEHRFPRDTIKPLLDAIPSSEVFRPFLQPESTRFLGVDTPKAGIYAVGSSRGNQCAEIAGDIESVIVALKTAAQELKRPGLPGPPEIDQARCTICLTCVRLCPHGAINFRKRAEVDPMSCVRCGICAAECPVLAISLPPPEGSPDIQARIREAFSADSGSGKIVAFLCSRSAAHAAAAAGPLVMENLARIVVPCAGTIASADILAAFRAGAAGVLSVGCHPGNCASVYGTTLAAERSAETARMLREAGVDPKRVLFATVASNSPADLVRAVRELEARISVSSETDSQ